jgi:type IV secretion system protein VirD4
MADAGGRGVQMAIVSHGLAQLRDRWGEEGAQIISDTAGCKVFLPGISDTALLKAASELCGQTAFRRRRLDLLTRHDICEPAMLRELPDGWALLIRGSQAPVLAKLPRAWTDKAYRRARRRGRAVYSVPAAAVVVPESGSLAAVPPVLAAPGAPGSPGVGGNGHREAGAFPWGGEDL